MLDADTYHTPVDTNADAYDSCEAARFDVAKAKPCAESGAAERTADTAVASSKLLRGLNRAADRAISRSYRTLNLKTIASGELLELASSLASIDGSRVAYCRHVDDGFVPHYHLVAQFTSPQHLRKLLIPVALADPCFYLRPCRVFRGSYRYLAHLDNPEKHRVPISDIVHLGDWDGTDLAKWQAFRMTNVSTQELVSLARNYLKAVDMPSLVTFAMYLDDSLVNARSALSGLRMMGISAADLFDYARQSTEQHETDC